MVSAVRSVASASSEGQKAPPKGILKDIIMNHAPSMHYLGLC